MRLKLHQSQPEKTKPDRLEPMVEGVVKSSRGREWRKIGDDEIIIFTKAYIADKEVKGREGLREADIGLYNVLRRRKLLDDIGLPDSNEGYRDWVGMERDGLLAHAKDFIAESGIRGRAELKTADPGLYFILRKRKLLDEAGLVSSNEGDRDWAAMRDEDLVAVADRFIVERRIGVKAELKRADAGLYKALRMRNLLCACFIGIESSKNKEAVDGVIDALASFGDDE